MIWVLTGENDYLRKQKLAQLTNDFISEHGEFGVISIDGSTKDFGQILDVIATQPFLTSKQLILLTSFLQIDDINEKFEEILESVADNTVLVINEPKFDKRSRVYKTLKQSTDFLEFNSLDGDELAKWLIGQASELGGEISLSEAKFLINRAGLNQMGLSNELDKLLSFDSKITKQNIELLVEPVPSSTVFDLLEAAFAGNQKKAIQLYQDQRKQQVEPQAIMGLIAWQVHTMAVVKLNENEHPSTIASNAKINPFVVRKTLGLVSKRSRKDIKSLVNRTVLLDGKLKSQPINADDALQHYLLTI